MITYCPPQRHLADSCIKVVWLGTRQRLAKLSTTELLLLSALVKPSSVVLDLGVTIDGQLTMADHVATLRRSCLFQLRQLQMVKSSLTLEAAKTLVHAFVSNRLDYCNSLLYGSVMACLRSCKLFRMQHRVS